MKVKNVKIDKLTIMGNLKKEHETSFQLLIDKSLHTEIFNARSSFVSGQFFSQDENSIYFEYDGLLAAVMNRRNFKIEFNPSKITDDQKIFLRKYVISYLTDLGFSRLDLAIDIDEVLSDYHFEVFGKSRTYIHSKSGELATFYIGSRKSKVMLRVYDKKRQLQEVENLEIEDSVLWRLEFELKGQDLIDFLREKGFDNVLDFRIIRYNFSELNAIDKILCKSYYSLPGDFNDLSRAKKYDIRKKLKACGGNDVSSDLKDSIKQKNSLILGELESYERCAIKPFI